MFRPTTAIFCSLLFFWCAPAPTFAECPNPSDLPAMYNKTQYLGAHWYDGDIGGTSESAIQSCNWAPRRYHDGVQFEAGRGRHFVKHSLVVRPGCAVYEFSGHAFRGCVKEYPTGVYPHVAAGSRSIKVRCDLEHVNCQPTDSFTTVLVCDATNAIADLDCTYNRTIGTSMSREVIQSMSLDSKLEKEMKGTFWNSFSSSLGVSNVTGYDWTKVSELVKQQLERFEVRATVPAGHVLKIEQVFGHCGENKVQTEFFRMSHLENEGVIEVKYLNSTENLTSPVNYRVLHDE